MRPAVVVAALRGAQAARSSSRMPQWMTKPVRYGNPMNALFDGEARLPVAAAGAT